MALSAAFDILCRVQPCWPCFVYSSTASLTIVVLCWTVHLKLYCSGCSRSWMQPPGWFSQRGRPNTRLHCSENYIGSESLSVSSFSWECDLPLSSRLNGLNGVNSELPCWEHSSSFQPRHATPSRICQHFNLAVGSNNTSFDTGWPRVFGVCSETLNFRPPHIRDAPSLLAFRRQFKTELSRLSYPVDWQSDIVRSLHCSIAHSNWQMSIVHRWFTWHLTL